MQTAVKHCDFGRVIKYVNPDLRKRGLRLSELCRGCRKMAPGSGIAYLTSSPKRFGLANHITRRDDLANMCEPFILSQQPRALLHVTYEAA